MASHACLRAEEAVEKLLKPFSPLTPSVMSLKPCSTPVNLTRELIYVKTTFFSFLFFPGCTGFNPYQLLDLLDQLHQDRERAEPGTDST